jgi:hypothetical protein
MTPDHCTKWRLYGHVTGGSISSVLASWVLWTFFFFFKVLLLFFFVPARPSFLDVSKHSNLECKPVGDRLEVKNNRKKLIKDRLQYWTEGWLPVCKQIDSKAD